MIGNRLATFTLRMAFPEIPFVKTVKKLFALILYAVYTHYFKHTVLIISKPC